LRKYRLLSLVVLPAAAGLVLLQPLAGSAQSGPTLVSNSQANMIAPAARLKGYVDNFPRNKQNEPAIARDPLTGAFVAGSNDEIDEDLCGTNPSWDPSLNNSVTCHFDPLVGSTGVYFSADGVHWTQPTYSSNLDGNGPNPIHTLPGYDTVGLVSNGDPAISFGPTLLPNGTFSRTAMTAYFGNLAFQRQLPSLTNGGALFAISRSYDDGQTWVPPVVANGPGSTAGTFNDKDHVHADASPASPFYGNVYGCYSLFPGSPLFSRELNDRIMFVRSTDGGATYSKPVFLSPDYNNNAVGGRQDCNIQSGPDGTVYVFWDDSINKVPSMVVAVSHDGGQTFTKRITVAAFNPVAFPLPNALFREFSYPTGAVDPRSGQVYDVWPTETNGHAQIALATSVDRGQSWKVLSAVGVNESAGDDVFFPAIDVSPNGTVVVSYNALRQTGVAPAYTAAGQPGSDFTTPGQPFGPGAVAQDTYAAVSTDHGLSFSAIRASTTSGDPDGASANNLTDQFIGDYTTVAATDHAAYPIWTDERNAAPCTPVDQYRAGQIAKSNPDLSCRNFGNTDIFTALVTY